MDSGFLRLVTYTCLIFHLTTGLYSIKEDDPVVEVGQGLIQGTIRSTPKGKSYYAFLGIPYAKPPIGELRFQVSIKITCTTINTLH